MSMSSLSQHVGLQMNKFTYRCGQPMPPYMAEALKFIGKVGVLTRPTWYVYLCPGTEQWKREQLLNMVKRGLLVSHTCKNLQGVWVLSDWSKDLLRSMGLSRVPPIYPHLIEHDLVVGTSMLTLKRQGICKDWLTETEIKIKELNNFLIEKKVNDSKYPDAVLRMQLNGNLSYVALEYERTGKSTMRYRAILKQYSSLKSIEQIIYVIEEQSIKKRIISALRHVGDKGLMDKIGFINGFEWKNDPATAPIAKAGKITSFTELLK